MYELKDGKIEFSHNPFSMPQGGIKALENENKQLDIYQQQFNTGQLSERKFNRLQRISSFYKFTHCPHTTKI